MKQPRQTQLVTWFPRYVIDDFLRSHFAVIDQYNELVVASIWSRWQSFVTGIEDLAIGFPVKNKMGQNPFGKLVTDQEIKQIIDKMKEDYSEIDVVVSNLAWENMDTPKNKPFGWNLQIKRFKSKNNFIATYELINYIKFKIPQTYPTKSPSVRLVIMLETYAPISFSTLLKHVDWDKFPFSELHFVWLHPDQKIYFGELWPDQYWYDTKKETLFTPPNLFLKRIAEIIPQKSKDI